MTETPDPDYERRVRESFGRQALMRTIGATLHSVEPGEVAVELVPAPGLTQQHGYVHAGVVAAVADTACGYAAATLMPAHSDVVSVEFKVNLLAPAEGERFVARARVLRAGRTLMVCQAEVFAAAPAGERLIAAMQATMIRIGPRAGNRT